MNSRSPFCGIALSRVADICFVSTGLFSIAASAQTAQTADQSASQEVVVTATRIPQPPRDVLSDTVVINADDIVQSGAASLVELLQRQRGIEVTSAGGPGTASSVFIRGAASEESVVLIDGVRVGSSTLGGATWENIPLEQIDRIEIVYGPLSSLYGADAMGGVVQIFTKRGDGAPHAGITAGYGSYNTRSVNASLSGADGRAGNESRIRYSLDVARDESDGFSATNPAAGPYTYNPDKDGYDKDSVAGQISLAAAQGHELGVGFLQSKNKAQFDEGPGFDDYELENLDTVRLYAHDRWTTDWSSVLQLAQSEDKFWSTNDGYTPTSMRTTQSLITWQNDINNIALGTDTLQLIAERREEKVDNNAGYSGERDTNSVAALYQWKSGRQLGVVSLRDDDSSQYGSKTTGNLAYGYRLTDAWRANASIGTSFRAPTFNELYYPGYGIPTNKPEQGKNAEAGFTYDDGKNQANIVFYRNRITDLLVYAPVCPVEPGNYPYGCAYNIDHAVLSGVSLGGRTTFGKLALRGSLDFQDPRDETTDTVLARRARQHSSLGIDYREGRFQVGAESVFSGKRFDDGANTEVLGGYGILNLHASVDLGSDWSLFARWNNVFNKDYELAYGYNTPGSNLFAGVRYGFK